MAGVPDYYFTQSAVIPYRRRNGRLQVLLITTRKSKRWVVPKGVKEPHLSARESAAREALEEAGVEGEISDRLMGRYEYDKWGGTCCVDVFAMEVHKVHKEWQESHRDREWVSVKKAIKRVNESALKQLLRSLPEIIPGGALSQAK